MTDVEIILRLPEKLVQDARQSNLLTDEKIAELLQAELNRELEHQQHLRAFLATADELASAEPKLTAEEITAEIKAARQQSNRM